MDTAGAIKGAAIFTSPSGVTEETRDNPTEDGGRAVVGRDDDDAVVGREERALVGREEPAVGGREGLEAVGGRDGSEWFGD